MKAAQLSKSEIDSLFQGKRVTFPEPHDHVVHDMTISSRIPVYARINRQDIIDQIGKDAHHKALSFKEKNVLFAEINILEREAASLSKYDKSKWQLARSFSDKVKQLKSVNQLTNGDAYELNKKLSPIYERLKNLREADQAKYEKESYGNFVKLESKIRDLSSRLSYSKEFKDLREKAKGIQQELKSTKVLKKENRAVLWNKINGIFETLHIKQKQDHEIYERECLKNYKNLKTKVIRCSSLADSSTDWKETRAHLKKVQGEFKGLKMKKEQRQELFDKLNKAFDTLWSRQKKDKDRYENECQRNYTSLRSKVSDCESKSRTATDWRDTREYFKKVQGEFKGIKLKRDQRQELFERMNKAFETLGHRQTKERDRYESECRSNYNRMNPRVREAFNKASYSDDFKGTRQLLKDTKSAIFDARPMKRDQKQELLNKMNAAFERLNSRAKNAFEARKAERERKQREWQARLRERISKLESAISRTEEGIYKAEEALRRQNDKLYNVRPGRREYEIKSSIRDRIRDIESSISQKKEKRYDMQRKLREMRSKLT